MRERERDTGKEMGDKRAKKTMKLKETQNLIDHASTGYDPLEHAYRT